MMSMTEMFYGEKEPVWVVKPEKKDKDGGKKEAAEEKQEYSILSAIPYYPYYYPDYVPAKKEEAGKDKKEITVLLKVPMCCGECEDSVTVALTQLKGVKSVECSTRKEKVTVVVTTGTTGVADILLECRKVFKKSRLWNDETD